jgi:hypothetical protein
LADLPPSQLMVPSLPERAENTPLQLTGGFFVLKRNYLMTRQQEEVDKKVRKPRGQMLPIASIRTDGGTQTRADGTSTATIDEYAEALRNDPELEFPPVVVFDDGTDKWLADGHHTLAAYSLVGLEFIPAKRIEGTQFDALVYALGANHAHGKRLTSKDKRHQVLLALAHPKTSKYSDRKIAEICKVGHAFVSNIHKALVSTVDTQNGSAPESPKGENTPSTSTSNGTTEDFKPTETASSPSEPPPPVPLPPPAPVDHLGVQIPEAVRPAFEALAQFDEVLSSCRALQKAVAAIAAGPAGGELKKDLQCRVKDDKTTFTSSEIHKLVGSLNFCRPYAAVCPYCLSEGNRDKANKKCVACRGEGWVSQAVYNGAPQEMREAVEALKVA